MFKAIIPADTAGSDQRVKAQLLPLFDIPYYIEISKRLAQDVRPSDAAVAICGKYNGNVQRALAAALSNGALDIVQLLIAEGTSLERMNEFGETPIYWAGLSGDIATINSLINDFGLHPLYAGVRGAPSRGNLFHALCREGFTDVVQHYASIPEFRAGLTQPSTYAGGGYTPLEEAICKGRFACVQTLLEESELELDASASGYKGFNLLGIALGCYGHSFTDDASTEQFAELATFIEYLIDDHNLDPFAINTNLAPIDAQRIEGLVIPDYQAPELHEQGLTYFWKAVATLIEQSPKLAERLYQLARHSVQQGENPAAKEFMNTYTNVQSVDKHPRV